MYEYVRSEIEEALQVIQYATSHIWTSVDDNIESCEPMFEFGADDARRAVEKSLYLINEGITWLEQTFKLHEYEE